eukprot:scaffold232635_cov58-Attheya_sp.AAC.1
MADMDRLLSAEFLNDKIINCTTYVASALSLAITIQGTPQNSTQNPLPEIALLSTYALQDVCLVPSDEYVLKFVECLNKNQVTEEELSEEWVHEDPFQEISVSWFATHAFGEIASVLGHYTRKDLVPTKLLCIFNRDVAMHWTVYDIDIENSVIYEYDSLNQWNAVVHKITLAKFLGIYKYQAMKMGPVYFGSKDMIMKSQPMADRVKRNEKQEIESTFAFCISPESSQLPHNNWMEYIVNNTESKKSSYRRRKTDANNFLHEKKKPDDVVGNGLEIEPIVLDGTPNRTNKKKKRKVRSTEPIILGGSPNSCLATLVRNKCIRDTNLATSPDESSIDPIVLEDTPTKKNQPSSLVRRKSRTDTTQRKVSVRQSPR